MNTDTKLRIGLYGIYGTYNFGCEAIVRGAVKFINDRYRNCQIVYFSYSYEFDRKALRDLDIEIVPLREGKTFVKRAVNKIFRYMGYDRRIMYIPFRKIMDKVDIIYSIGGDIYTIPAFQREKPEYEYYNHLVDFCNRAISCEKRVIVYGASVGPFGAYEKAVSYYVKNLKRYDRILCREQDSVEYLRSLGLDNMVFSPDPAFTVRLENNEKMIEKYIGINLSPLSLNEVNGDYGEREIDSMASLMDNICKRFGTKLLFLPHVISENPNDNDYQFMKRVHHKMKCQDEVSFADYSGGFLGIKRQLRECKIVISARMHCAINAICENIPTILLSYSQKSVGMCKYVYGNDEWIVEVKNLDDHLIKKVKKMLDNRERIKDLLSVRNREIQQYIDEQRFEKL